MLLKDFINSLQDNYNPIILHCENMQDVKDNNIYNKSKAFAGREDLLTSEIIGIKSHIETVKGYNDIIINHIAYDININYNASMPVYMVSFFDECDGATYHACIKCENIENASTALDDFLSDQCYCNEYTFKSARLAGAETSKRYNKALALFNNAFYADLYARKAMTLEEIKEEL